MEEQDHILLAEEDSEDALLIHLALKRAGISSPVHVVTTSAEVISYLKGEGVCADRNAYPLPAMIILALRLPLLHGFDLLRWIRSHLQFNRIPIAVLAGIQLPGERRLARELGADSYEVKPPDFDQLVKMAERLRDRWLQPKNPHQSFQRAA